MKKKLDINMEAFIEEVKELFGDKVDMNQDFHVEPDVDDPSIGYSIGRAMFINTVDGKMLSFNKFKQFPVISMVIDEHDRGGATVGAILLESQVEKLIDFLNSKLRELRQKPPAVS